MSTVMKIKKGKEKEKVPFYSVSSGSQVKRQKKTEAKTTTIGLDKREAHHTLTK